MRYTQPYGITDTSAAYVNGDPSIGREGSIPPAAAIEHPQRELHHLIAWAVADAAARAELENGIALSSPSSGDLQQVRKAIQLMASSAGNTVINNILLNNPTFPQIETATAKMSFSTATGRIDVDVGCEWVHRGVARYTTTDFALEARRFNTSPSKTYHLRWHAPGTGDATPASSYPMGRFVLKDCSNVTYNPSALAETSTSFDTTYDDMLVALVVSDGANALTVTSLKNKAVLYATAAKTTYEYNGTGSPLSYRHLPHLDLTINWGRTPTLWAPVSMETWWPASGNKSIVAFAASFKAQTDSYLDPTNYYEPAYGPTRYIARAAVYGYDSDDTYNYKSGTITMQARA